MALRNSTLWGMTIVLFFRDLRWRFRHRLCLIIVPYPAMRYLRLVTLLLIFLAACLPVQTGRPEEPAMTDEPTTSPEPDLPPDTALKPLVDRARLDLAARLGIDGGRISVSSAKSVTWPDSSLGCPQPGMAYLQILSPGYLVVLEAAEKRYEYHAGRDGKVFYCEGPVPPVPGEAGDI